MAKKLTVSLIVLIVMSMFRVSLAQELITNKNSSWIKKETPAQCQREDRIDEGSDIRKSV